MTVWCVRRAAKIEFVALKDTMECLNSGVNIILFVSVREKAGVFICLRFVPSGARIRQLT